MDNIVYGARLFATAAHGAINQRRKWSNEPYIVHPFEVASIVAWYFSDPEMIAAAWLHDVVEDTSVTIDDIYLEFGKNVGDYVDQLTNRAKFEDGNRAVRKQINYEWTKKASQKAKSIKLADILHNATSMRNDMKNHPDLEQFYNKVWAPEKRMLLNVLTEGHESLYNATYKILSI